MRPKTWKKLPNKRSHRGPKLSNSLPKTGPCSSYQQPVHICARDDRAIRTQKNIINVSMDGIHATVLDDMLLNW